VKFLPSFFQKAGFWLLFSKSNITYKDFLILFLKKIPKGNFPFDKDSIYVE